MQDRGEWRPRLFQADHADDRAALVELRRSGEVRFVHDVLRGQLEELLAAREPARSLSPAEMEARVACHLDGRALDSYGAWVYYPWSLRLVHVLPVEELREVRTDRNRYKITAEEQRRLAAARVGVIGLSVGNMAAVTCALEGVGGEFRLADFDTLSLSNLNRLRGGLHQLGLHKTVLAAREMLEIDPYLKIELHSEGVTAENVDAFLAGLDVLVEECDDLQIKVLVRERARALRIPVVMDTSDRGLLDVERFDLEPGRPVLHGLLGDVRAAALAGLSTRDKVPYVLAILGGRSLSTRMAASLPEVKESISTWPQLASGVALGGAITADVVRRILLGEHRESGRYYVDVESLVRDGAGALREPAPAPAPPEIAPEALAPPSLPPRPPPGELGRDAVRWLVAHGTLAPSAHNAQPWRFHFSAGVLACEHDPSHDLPTLDFEQGATWVAFGAFLENLALAAAAIGLRPEVEPFPEAARPRLVCRVRFSPAPVEERPLFPCVARRVTNRRRGPRQALPPGAAAALADAAAPARLQLLTGDADLDEIGALMGACDRVTAFNRAIHEETMAGFRWTRAEVERHRDGLDVTTMELSAPDRAGLELLSHWPFMEALGALGGGRVLEEGARKQVAAASAVGLLTVPGVGRESYLAGGRAMQRLWLTATARRLALQPITGLPYLFARLERGGGRGLAPAERTALAALVPRYRALFDAPPPHAEVLLFRLAVADPPTARALRRRVDDVLTFA